MAEVDLRGPQLPEPVERLIVGLTIRRPAATLELVGLTGPLVDRVDGLPGQDDDAPIRLDRERLVALRVTRRGDDPEPIERLGPGRSAAPDDGR